MGDISKLPKWAREEIALLRSQVEDRDRHIAEMAGQVEETDTYIYNLSHPGLDHALPKGQSVRFVLNEDRGQAIIVRLREDGLELYAQGGVLQIAPHSSNVVLARVSRDW